MSGTISLGNGTIKRVVRNGNDTSKKKNESKNEFDSSSQPSTSKTTSASPRRLECLVDPQWELIDPTPDIHALFLQFNDTFFQGTLAGCEVRWSPRMTLCAGLCSYEGRGGLCSIRLSKPLLSLRPRKDLVETLLHEMIHAYLFVTVRNRDRDGHGESFQFHMRRINARAGTHITIYHSFHAEVRNYHQHWWRCEGVCRKRPPFFGFVKRAMNRAPGPSDYWWSRHQASCGGKFVKVKEPEGYANGKKKSLEGSKRKIETAESDNTESKMKRSKSESPSKPTQNQSQITNFFPFSGTGHTTESSKNQCDKSQNSPPKNAKSDLRNLMLEAALRRQQRANATSSVPSTGSSRCDTKTRVPKSLNPTFPLKRKPNNVLMPKRKIIPKNSMKPEVITIDD